MVMWLDKDNSMSIPEYFTGQSILITGGTGFMGKVLVEKILRSCPDVAKIYLLIRPKKNVPIEDRWSKLTELPLFDRLKSERPDALKKIELIPGDIKDEDLCPEEYKKMLQENVTMIYHAAAMIQFVDNVTDALIQNVKGTAVLLELARRMCKLQVFVYVSTAYSNFDKPSADAEEKVLPSCQDWKVLLQLLQREPLNLAFLKEKLLCGHPNAYTWSKSIAEQIANEYNKFFPVIIMRPSIVSSTVQEPLPTWSDGTSGFFAYCTAVATGMLHVTKVSIDDYPDIVPVDIAIKAFLIAPWKLHLTKEQGTTEVYNCATAMDYIMSYRDIQAAFPEVLEQYPSKYILWQWFCFYVQNPLLHNIVFFLLQILPAAILDFLLQLQKKKPMFTKLNIFIINAYRVGERIMCNQIKFPNQRFKELGTDLKEEDKENFGYNHSPAKISKTELLKIQYVATLKHYLKEDLSEENLIKNRERYHRIKLMHRILVNTTKFVIFPWFLVFVGRRMSLLIQ